MERALIVLAVVLAVVGLLLAGKGDVLALVLNLTSLILLGVLIGRRRRRT